MFGIDFYFLEVVLMVLPGVNALYPYLPGGATSALVQIDFLTDSLGDQTSLPTGHLLTPASEPACW